MFITHPKINVEPEQRLMTILLFNPQALGPIYVFRGVAVTANLGLRSPGLGFPDQQRSFALRLYLQYNQVVSSLRPNKWYCRLVGP